MLPKHEALIGCVYDNGIFKLARCLEVVKKTANVVIYTLYASQKFSEVRVVGKFLIFIVRVVFWVKVCWKLFRVPFWQVAEVRPPRVSSANRCANVGY